MPDVPRVKIGSILDGQHTGEEILIQGWIHRHRSTGGIVFAVVRDATGVLQCTVKKDKVGEEVFAEAETTDFEASVRVTGVVEEDERAPEGYELQVTGFAEVGESPDVPLYEDQGIEHELDHRHLWLRSQELTDVAKVRHTAMDAVREWFTEEDFWQVWPSILTKNAAEGGANVFELEYFEEPAYLTQSSQMYLEAMIYSLERVWCLAPSFRAEKSRTPRHLTEYWHLEAEQAWCDNEENIEIQEQLVAHACNAVAERAGEQVEQLGRDPATLAEVAPPFDRVTYDETVELLQEESHDISWGEDFGAPDERALARMFDGFVFVTHFPAKMKAFYMAQDEDEVYAKCADLLGPEGYGELIGGSERSTDLDLVERRLEAEGEDVEDYEWFLDLREYGSVPHSGFGLGVERFVAYLCNLDHVRDAVPFPRTPNRIQP
ncbi:asparagine--tRNA ligase [Thermoplasmatales archaeon SW_10_69_26]|nr:MAG: asparagine--tRNA ligase [Thermoplasmatales archaeon SW_10_69_26]